MKAYKLVRKLKDGNCYPLFIDKNRPFLFKEERIAECHITPGFSPRTGFHVCIQPVAPHLKEKLSNGEQRAWIECEVDNYTVYDRPESQGGEWVLAQKFTALREMPWNEVRDMQLSYFRNKKHKYINDANMVDYFAKLENETLRLKEVAL